MDSLKYAFTVKTLLFSASLIGVFERFALIVSRLNIVFSFCCLVGVFIIRSLDSNVNTNKQSFLIFSQFVS